MPFYIFTRVKGDAAWELAEALKGDEAARKVSADDFSFLRDQVGAEVTMVVADSL